MNANIKHPRLLELAKEALFGSDCDSCGHALESKYLRLIAEVLWMELRYRMDDK